MASTYDPVKAHAYYMRTRKLKGRRRAKMTPELKDQLKRERAQIMADTKAQRTALTDLLKMKKDLIRQKIKNLKGKANKAEADKLRATIKELTAKGTEIREKIRTNHAKKMLDAENAIREKAGLPPKEAKPTITATPTTTKLDEQYKQML